MLYDPKWGKPEVKADPFSLDALIAWLEMMPADRVYCWVGMGTCLLAQWAQSVDPDAQSVGLTGNSFDYSINGSVRSLRDYSRIACGDDIHDTFGAALERARAARSLCR